MSVKLLYRKMFLEFVQIFIVCLAVFLSIILSGRLIQLGKVFVSLDVSLSDIVRLIFYLSPFFLFVLLPVCSLLTLFLVFQRMSSDNELIALRCGGISLFNIMPCAIIFLFLLTGINFFISFYGISWGMERFNTYLINLARKKAKLIIKPGTFNTNIPGFLIYTQKTSKNSEELTHVFIKQKIDPQKDVVIVSPKGFLKWNPRKKVLYFSLENGTIYEDMMKKQKVIISFGEYEIKLDLKKVFKALKIRTNDQKFMSYKTINRLIRTYPNKKSNYYIELKEEKHKRIAMPISCFILGIFAIPLGWILESMKKFYGTIIVMIMFFIYYMMFAMGKSLVEGGVLSPVIGIWAPNVIFFILSMLGFYIAQREKFKFSIRD